jgi:Zn finger protein HypA/HybF involved in hydrogenase expression
VTDLAPSDADATRSCPQCGAQNELDASTCPHCGASTPLAVGRDDERGDLEVVEVARAAGVAGFDTEFVAEADGVRCSACNAGFPLRDAAVASVDPAMDTASGAVEVAVVSVTCPSCGTQGHVVLPRDATGEVTPAEPGSGDLSA